WLDADAINAESSGYFLVKRGAQGAGMRPISRSEGASIRGMGATTIFDKNGNTQHDPRVCSKTTPMCQYGFHLMLVSLALNDTPVGYAPPIGPSMFTTLSYSQREANQPALPTFSNYGPKWTSNWLAYVVDNPRIPGAGVFRYAAGGGGYD